MKLLGYLAETSGICGSEIYSYHGLYPTTFYPVVHGHSNRFAFEEYDDAYKFIDSHRETSMKVIVDLEQKPEEK